MNKLMAPLMLTTLTVALSSCSSDPKTPVAPPVQVTGTVKSGSGEGKISLAGTGTTVLASAPVAADGSFTLNLPDAGALAGQLVSASTIMANVGCVGNLISSNAAAKGFGFAALNAVRSGASQQVYAASAQGNVASVSSEMNMDLWVYVDQATNLSGSVDCTKLANSPQVSAISAKFQNPQTPVVSLNAGWNVVHFKGTSGITGPYDIKGAIFNPSASSKPASSWLTIDDAIKNLSIRL
ncbi:hypothetical protein [Deinococcus sp.]|uniref:hypothetical protein n=1 Tax=Deinococcus sp. TaxID=47478 RepID=UPI0025BA1B71|nr:hypothetical protein [Deinococcus sp.]